MATTLGGYLTMSRTSPKHLFALTSWPSSCPLAINDVGGNWGLQAHINCFSGNVAALGATNFNWQSQPWARSKLWVAISGCMTGNPACGLQLPNPSRTEALRVAMSFWQLSSHQNNSSRRQPIVMDLRFAFHSREPVPLRGSHYMGCWRETNLFLLSLKIESVAVIPNSDQ